MALNKSKGNMYEFVTHTWNTVKGACPHDCGYCYMKGLAKRFNKPQCPAYFDENELKTNLGSGNFIFVGSSNDLFAANIPEEWIIKTMEHCNQWDNLNSCHKFDNNYLFQTKNPMRIAELIWAKKFPYKRWRDVFCVTIESNRDYSEFMMNAPKIDDRFTGMGLIDGIKHLTIEPIMDFDTDVFVEKIKNIGRAHLGDHVKQVNIGADSGHNKLPEPPKEKVLELIAALEEFTTVKQKSNLSRILK
jgi:DNA repair photolyase